MRSKSTRANKTRAVSAGHQTGESRQLPDQPNPYTGSVWRRGRRLGLALVFLVSLFSLGCQSEAPNQATLWPPTLTPAPTPTLADSIGSASVGVGGRPDGSPTVSATPSPIPPTPTPTPLPARRWELAQQAFHNGDYLTVIHHLESYLAPRSDAEPVAARWLLNRAYMLTGDTAAAQQGWQQLLERHPDQIEAHFFLGELYAAQGACPEAIAAYTTYLEQDASLAAYVQPRIGDCHLLLGQQEAGRAAYLAAQTADAHFLVTYFNRLTLAEHYMAEQDYLAAAEVYETIRNAARTYVTQGEMTYYAGYAKGLAGDTAGSYSAYQQAIDAFPDLYTSYQALIALINAQQPVDEFQRGLVDYYAGAYQPAVEAFERYLADPSPDYRLDAYLYLAWSYAALGQTPQAYLALEQYQAANPPDPGAGLAAEADLLAQEGQLTEAIAVYAQLLTAYPDHEQALHAAWQQARLTAALGDLPTAIEKYVSLAEQFPTTDDAPEALVSAATLAQEQGISDQALALWREAATRYPDSAAGLAARLRLVQAVPDDPLAQSLPPLQPTYFHLRLHHWVNNQTPFTSPSAINLDNSRVRDQAEAETWLRQQLQLAPEAEIATLSPSLAADPALIRGEKLWRLGQLEAARQEFEAVRQHYAQDALASYQLALYFRDLGVYRSSIMAASAVFTATQSNVFSAPPFIGGLAYPVYYADLIVPLAVEYGFDPLLQFALVRQESLFESFATSSAVAQGLAQVIPATGEYIAARLGWPDYRNEALYRPYVGLRFGAYYLAEQLQTFEGFIPAALAAYNGGPGNALRWQTAGGRDLDVFIDVIDFSETRLYVERIYIGHTIYRYLYGES